MNANPYQHGLRELTVGLVQRADNLEPSPNSTGGIIFMRSRVGKVNEEDVTQILRNMALMAFDDLSAHLLVGPHDRLQFFGVKLF